MKKIILIALLLLSSQVQAEELPDWLTSVLKVDNPDELAVWVNTMESCPVTIVELKEIVSGVLIRSRVKPLFGDEVLKNSLYLSATVQCMAPFTEGGNQIYTVNIRYGKINGLAPILYNHPYGSIGTNDKEGILAVYKKRVEEAITDYIKVNFNL